MAWARKGAPEGSLVVAEQQISARARPRRPWPSGGEKSVALTLIVRPHIAPVLGGILHIAATAGVADAFGPNSEVEWPDEVYVGETVVGLVSVHIEQTVRGLEWALINVMLPEVAPPRAMGLARVVQAVERRYQQPVDELIEEWEPRCRTIGRSVVARLYPIGRDRRVSGHAVGVGPTGALTIEDELGLERGIRPHELATWEGSEGQLGVSGPGGG
jgi:BirA family biotin operon repressor/biotin-[acetyl-CoA-carboxylase] ligase